MTLDYFISSIIDYISTNEVPTSRTWFDRYWYEE